jgi:hypothetical protein
LLGSYVSGPTLPTAAAAAALGPWLATASPRWPDLALLVGALAGRGDRALTGVGSGALQIELDVVPWSATPMLRTVDCFQRGRGGLLPKGRPGTRCSPHLVHLLRAAFAGDELPLCSCTEWHPRTSMEDRHHEGAQLGGCLDQI